MLFTIKLLMCFYILISEFSTIWDFAGFGGFVVLLLFKALLLRMLSLEPSVDSYKFSLVNIGLSLEKDTLTFVVFNVVVSVKAGKDCTGANELY